MPKPIVKVNPSEGKNRIFAIGLVLAYLLLAGLARAENAHSYWDAKAALTITSLAGAPAPAGPVLACATKRSDDDNLLGLGVVLDDLLGGLLGGLTVNRIAVISWAAVAHATTYDVEFTPSSGPATVISTPVNSLVVSSDSGLVTALLGTVGAVLLPASASTAQIKVRPKYGTSWVGNYSANSVKVRHAEGLEILLLPGVFCAS